MQFTCTGFSVDIDARPIDGFKKLMRGRAQENFILGGSTQGSSPLPYHTVKFRKYAPPCINPFKYKPPKLVTQITPPIIYKSPGGLYLESCPQIQSKTKQKR